MVQASTECSTIHEIIFFISLIIVSGSYDSHFSTKELEGFIKEIPAHFHNHLVIHSHHKLALKYNLKGFHFTSTHLGQKFKLWWNTPNRKLENFKA